MMAALTTVFGMSPLVSDLFFQGMAISVMGGLTVAAVITLIATPVFYAMFFGIKEGEEHLPPDQIEADSGIPDIPVGIEAPADT